MFFNSAQYCLNSVCQNAVATCADACRTHSGTAGGSGGGGGAGGSGGGGVSVSYVTACSLSRWSSDFSVTATMYGSAALRADALSAAQTQCSAADWAGWFCAGASESCTQEKEERYSCTFEKWSSEHSETVHYYGTGSGQTAARAAAVDSCVRSGAWRGWFCTSGLFTCTRT